MPGLPFPTGSWIGTLLVDGFFRAYWKIEDATLSIDRFAPRGRPPVRSTAIVAEGERLLAHFVAPGASDRRALRPEAVDLGHAAAISPSRASTWSSCVFGDTFGITWRTTPCSSITNVARSAPQ